MGCGVWSEMCGVRCEVCGVRCVLCEMWVLSDVCFLHRMRFTFFMRSLPKGQSSVTMDTIPYSIPYFIE